MARQVRDLTGGVQPKFGRVRLDLPEVAEYGDTVPLTIEVESPMTDADHVEAVYIFAEENPFIRYRRLFHIYWTARAAGVSDADY